MTVVATISSIMATYIFTWNPTQFEWEHFDQDRAAVRDGRSLSHGDSWSTGNRTNIHQGERFFLLRQHDNRGIIGSGYTTSDGYEDEHWSDSNRTARYVHIRFDQLLSIGEALPVEQIERLTPAFPWNRLQASGIEIAPADAASLEDVWRAHLEDLGQLFPPLPDEVIGPAPYAGKLIGSRITARIGPRSFCVALGCDASGCACSRPSPDKPGSLSTRRFCWLTGGDGMPTAVRETVREFKGPKGPGRTDIHSHVARRGRAVGIASEILAGLPAVPGSNFPASSFLLVDGRPWQV